MGLTIDQALLKGVTAHKEGRLQDAESLYREILRSQPTHPDANHNLGLIAVSLGKADVALPLFKMALEANPKVEQFWVSYITALIKKHRFDDATQALEQARTQNLDDATLTSLEAQIIDLAGKSLITIDNPPRELLQSLGEHYQGGRFIEAEKLSVGITKEFPSHPFAWTVLGAVLAHMGRHSEAVDANKTVVALSPENAEAHNNLGNTLKELGRLFEAEASYTHAISLKPKLAEAHNNLGLTYQELGILDKAENSLKEAIALKSDYAVAYSNLSLTLQELGKLDEAETNAKIAITLKPDYARAHNNLGVTLKELGKLEEAEVSYNKAIALEPNLADALYNRSLLLFDKAEYEGALRDADACHSKKSRAHALTCLYALGRINEIYKRIEIQSKVDDDDISIAAFAAFISAIKNKPTIYNFCPNPMNFIYVSNLSSHMADSVMQSETLVEELSKIEASWEPSGQSTVNGFHSLKGINLFESPSGKIAQLKGIIIAELETYYKKFQNERCSFIRKFPTTRNIYGWTITLKQQGYQDTHIHPAGWLSGVIYLKVVPSLGKDEGAIEFSLNGENYSDSASPKRTHQPKFGDIVLFPSSLAHRTIPFSTDVDRTIVSFDLIPGPSN